MANTFAEARDAIAAVVRAAWIGATAAPLVYDGFDQDPPDDAIFGRLTVRYERGERASLGPARFRRFGRVYVQIFVPLTKRGASADYDPIAHAVAGVLENPGATAGNVWFRNVGLQEIGVDRLGQYFQVQVTAEFTFDRIE